MVQITSYFPNLNILCGDYCARPTYSNLIHFPFGIFPSYKSHIMPVIGSKYNQRISLSCKYLCKDVENI
jgi:hypothetical protein